MAPPIRSPVEASMQSADDRGPRLLWILTEDFDAVYGRAGSIGAEKLMERHRNAEDDSREFSLRDLDGYAIGISESSG